MTTPARLVGYFLLPEDNRTPPVVTQTFMTGRGWQPVTPPRHATHAYLRQLGRCHVLSVAVSHGGRVADFTTRELVAGARR